MQDLSLNDKIKSELFFLLTKLPENEYEEVRRILKDKIANNLNLISFSASDLRKLPKDIKTIILKNQSLNVQNEDILEDNSDIIEY